MESKMSDPILEFVDVAENLTPYQIKKLAQLQRYVFECKDNATTQEETTKFINIGAYILLIAGTE